MEMSKNSFETQRGTLTLLCSKALQGSLSLEDFYAEWPDDISDSEFASLLYEDIEDGVQHYPGHLFTGKPDTKAWESSQMYMSLYLDKQLLLSGAIESTLIKVRQHILQEGKLTPKKIDAQLSQIFGANKQSS